MPLTVGDTLGSFVILAPIVEGRQAIGSFLFVWVMGVPIGGVIAVALWIGWERWWDEVKPGEKFIVSAVVIMTTRLILKLFK